MENKDRQILTKLISEADIIAELLSGNNFEAFVADEKTKRAACMTLINIGELVKGLSDDFKQTNPTIPWRAISGLRDVTAHRYQALRMEDIWVTIQTDIPVLRKQLADLCGNLP